MSSIVVVGTQWGDEGKGKIVDLVTSDIDAVVRSQGGNNAGHTVIVDGVKYVLRLIPSGILHPDKSCMIASGVVLDPVAFCEEMNTLKKQGVSITPKNLKLSAATHLIMPYHKKLDQAREKSKGANKIGTTGRGIGPCYEDKVSRIGIRVADLADKGLLQEKISIALQEKNTLLKNLYQEAPMTVEDVLNEVQAACDEIMPFTADVCGEIDNCFKSGGKVLFEGAQGTQLDIDHGTYPFVTSSNTVSGGAATGCGLGPWRLNRILGITKAYTTRVGAGPFITELTDETGAFLQKNGFEFGVNTGRTRRCGWFDAVVLRQAVRLNGVTDIALTKLDVLSGLKEIKICVAYQYDGKTMDYPPQDLQTLQKVEPVYETLPGWDEDITKVLSEKDLPANTQAYIKRIEELIGVKASIISVGPDRNQTIIR